MEGLIRLSGGASRETWAFESRDARGTRASLILRRDFPAEAAPAFDKLAGTGEGVDRRGEFELLRVLADRGLPVPRPVAYPEAGSPLEHCFVMERIEGETLPRRILREPDYAEARAGLADELGTLLGRWRAISAEELPPLPEQPAAQQLALCRGLLDRGPERRPVLELAYRWLCERRPPDPERLSLVHGDFRIGNFVVGPEGLRSVLDWEYVHLGDPLEDVGFLCLKPWRFGNVALEVGGFGRREDLLRSYEEATGTRVDREAVRFWEVLGQLKWGGLCAARCSLHLEGVHRSVEVAAIGRRVAETEYDLLELIE